MKNFSKKKSTLLTLVIVVTFVSAITFGKGTVTKATNSTSSSSRIVDHTTKGWVLENAKKNSDGTVSVKIMEVPNFEVKTYTTAISLADSDHTNSITCVTRADALADFSATGINSTGAILAQNAFVEIQFNNKNQCIDMEVIEFSEVTYMDSASYGGELTARGGGAGSMVATGWVLDKNKANNTITIGDGNHVTNVFEETYKLADDVKIYAVDNPSTDGNMNVNNISSANYNVPGTWKLVKDGSFDDIKVTDKKDGEIYYVPERWNAVCIFDSNYKTSWKDGKAKVKEIYLFNNAIKLSKKNLATPDGMQYDGTSWYPAKSKLEEKTWFSYNGSAEPIELLKNRLYDVGDTYTEVYLFVGANGSLSLLDQGNRNASYQYWLNIAKLGYDPRKVENILLTHGHGDHYQALYENQLMIKRARGKVNSLINPYALGATIENSNYTVAATLPDKPVLSVVDGKIDWDKWMDFMGKGINLYAWRSLGHTNDTASFVFKVTATKDDAYFKKGDVVSFVYYGGFGAQGSLSSGSQRLGIMDGLQYQQSVITPWAKAQSDYVYPLPQHSNHYSIHEINKASKKAKISFMEGMTEGIESVANMAEKRVSVQLYESFEQAYRSGTDLMDKILKEAGVAFKCDSSAATSFDTVEAHGPYKRPAGEYTIKVQSVQVLHGFDAFMNKNEKFKGQKNIYGFDLSQGFVTDKDSYTHDPEGWYVQVNCNVLDRYDGGVDYETNWYKGNYTTGINNTPITKPWNSGPVDVSISPYGWTENLRTLRFDTKQEAEAYAKALTNGAYTTPYQAYGTNGLMYKYNDKENHAITDHDGNGGALQTASYKVQLNNASEILLGKNFEDTFKIVK
jgi:hypothetical protein